MKALQLSDPGPVDTPRLQWVDRPVPEAPVPEARANESADRVLLQVRACGVCHTDLHIVEGDLPLHKRPVIPGHQVVATVATATRNGSGLKMGERVGVPWLFSTCGVCAFCRRGDENLCDNAQFTGWDVDGGYAGYLLARPEFVVPIPDAFDDVAAAPLLCAGVIGYRSLRLAEVQPGERLGLVGFGASAHLAIQVARHWGCQVAVMTRSAGHRRLAEELGAVWTGTADQTPPWPLDRAVIFAPAGALVPLVLGQLRKGGTLAINAIHMSRIPEMDYNLLYGERTLRSVANATRRDATEFMALAVEAHIAVETEVLPLEQGNAALLKLKRSEVRGAAVLVPHA
jgi:propanol-preferring alcohol dehydrogenase